jgi:hypothetical protein
LNPPEGLGLQFSGADLHVNARNTVETNARFRMQFSGSSMEGRGEAEVRAPLEEIIGNHTLGKAFVNECPIFAGLAFEQAAEV